MLNSGDMGALQDKFKADTKQIIEVEEKLLLKDFQKAGIKVNFLFSNHNYPLTIDEEIKNELLEKIDDVASRQELDLQISLGEFSFSQISSIVNFSFFFDMFFGMKKFEKKFNLVYPKFGDGLQISCGKIFIWIILMVLIMLLVQINLKIISLKVRRLVF